MTKWSESHISKLSDINLSKWYHRWQTKIFFWGNICPGQCQPYVCLTKWSAHDYLHNAHVKGWCLRTQSSKPVIRQSGPDLRKTRVIQILCDIYTIIQVLMLIISTQLRISTVPHDKLEVNLKWYYFILILCTSIIYCSRAWNLSQAVLVYKDFHIRQIFLVSTFSVWFVGVLAICNVNI